MKIHRTTAQCPKGYLCFLARLREMAAHGIALVGLLVAFAPASMGAGNDPAEKSGRGPAVGAQGRVGCLADPQRVRRLRLDRPGVYENYLVDSDWAGGNRVKITAHDVVLRHCEIRNATGNGIGVFGENVLIENCRIHHLLAGTFQEQEDAHGITGGWNNVTIRNCEIFYVSGDCVQFDPDRRTTGQVLIENCTFRTGPLPADAAGFRQGERPGENGIDTKTPGDRHPSLLVVRKSLLFGWKQPGQIGTMAALNLKENVKARVEQCLFRDNQVCFRLRGPTGRGGAEVRIADCAIYDSEVGVRMEDKLRNLKIDRLGFGPDVARRHHRVGSGPFPGYENRNEYRAPPFAKVLHNGFPVFKPH